MNIRKLTAADLSAFREIRVEMCGNHPEAFSQTADEVAEMPDDKMLEWMSLSDSFPESFVLAAFENGRILGTVAFKREETQKERHRGWIWSVYTSPEGRGQGIARALMKGLIDKARRMEGMEILTLVVSLPQTEARALYKSLGFIVTGLIVHGYKLPDGRYVDEEEMMFWL